jgi:hypothetical protein
LAKESKDKQQNPKTKSTNGKQLFVGTDRTIPDNRPDIVFRDNEKEYEY